MSYIKKTTPSSSSTFRIHTWDHSLDYSKPCSLYSGFKGPKHKLRQPAPRRDTSDDMVTACHSRSNRPPAVSLLPLAQLYIQDRTNGCDVWEGASEPMQNVAVMSIGICTKQHLDFKFPEELFTASLSAPHPASMESTSLLETHTYTILAEPKQLTTDLHADYSNGLGYS